MDTIVELRRYTLHPGARDTLVELFSRELVGPQEAVGMHVLAWFADVDDPDAFVWLRGFADLEARDQGLRAFYEGPVWERHKDAANATMIDSDDVLLLRPLHTGELADRAVVTTFALTRPLDADLATAVVDELLDATVPPQAILATHDGPNTYPRLPVREGEQVLVVVADAVTPAPAALAGVIAGAPHVLRLAPTDET